MSPAERDAAVDLWCATDRAQRVLPADHDVVDASRALRALVVELALAGGQQDELYDACAIMGRLIAQLRGSPTLASATLDNACDAMGAGRPAWLIPARAALTEGFVAALVEGVRAEDMQSWEYPACAVPLGEAAIAIAAGHPSDDDEVLAAWAARVARGAAARGTRRAVVGGGERARAALLDALALAGVEVHASGRPGSGGR